MRLTLRTMLAYMDGILDAEDAENIGKRIDESEQATSLLHRTRDVMRRLRLAAPSLTDREPGLDPNTVAEYLDNTLQDNRVTDFEKVCLDSDIHLAEVASCHQILALVLGEAAETDPASRQRMYEIPSVEAAQREAESTSATVEESSGDGQSPSETALAGPRPKPTVPDYLRDPPKKKRRFLPVAVALALVACVAVIVLIALAASGQLGSETPLGGALAQLLSSDQPQPQGPGDPGDDPTDQPGPKPAQQPKTEPAQQPETEPAEQPETEPPEQPETEPAEQPETEPPEQPETEPAEQPEIVQLDRPPKGIGALMSEKQVLLRFDFETGRWQRVAQRGIVTAGQKLLALPTYRPLIALMSAEITIELIDGTQAELLPADAAGVPGVKVDYGRLVMHTVGKPEAQIRLQVGSLSGLFTFVDAQSVLALEVIPVHVPGTDPESDPGSVVADVYAETGQILWDQAGSQQTVRVPAGNWVMINQQPTQAPVPVEEFPKWVAGGDMNSLEMGADRRASETLAKELQVERSVRFGARLKLMELNEHPRRENRWLAARCLGYIDDFEPLVAALNDADHPLVWTDESVEHLRAAVARSPEAAARVRAAMEKEYGQNAAELYRMLWGYTQEGLKERRQAERLVELLDHETLAMRTLSFWNLRGIFGLGLMYKATEREPTRRAHAQRWRQRLQSGEIWTRLSGRSRAAPAEKAAPPEETEAANDVEGQP